MFLNNLAMLRTMPYALSAKLHTTGTQVLATLTDEDISGLFTDQGAAAEGEALGDAMGLVKSFGSGTTSIAQTVAIFIAVIMFFVGVIAMLLHSGNSQKRAEDKESMGWKVLAVILLGGGVTAITALITFGSGIFG